MNETITPNTVIGWHNGTVFVLLNDKDLMFYKGLPEKYALIGEAFTIEYEELKMLRPISELPDNEQNNALKALSDYLEARKE